MAYRFDLFNDSNMRGYLVVEECVTNLEDETMVIGRSS